MCGGENRLPRCLGEFGFHARFSVLAWRAPTVDSLTGLQRLRVRSLLTRYSKSLIFLLESAAQRNNGPRTLLER